jgi:ABC-type transport system involved in multi-copper enzyme maturation permease subunit
VLAVTGPHLADLTGNVFDQLTPNDRRLYWAATIVVAMAPALIGAFWGAPLVARELEAGTHRLAWTQSVTRTRWLATRVGLTVLAAAAAMGVLVLAVTWWAAPLDGATSETHGSLPDRLTPVVFGMRGIVPVAYGVFAVAAGVAVGTLLRRSLPAMATTLVVVAFAQIAVPLWVRPHLVTPVTQTVAISSDNLDGIGLRGGPDPILVLTVHTGDRGEGNRGDWVLSNDTIDSAGRTISSAPAWFAQCLPPPSAEGAPATVQGKGTLEACFTRLAAEGYRQKLVYQPAGRFWPLQWAETGVFLALSGLLAWFSFWWVRRRLT